MSENSKSDIIAISVFSEMWDEQFCARSDCVPMQFVYHMAEISCVSNVIIFPTPQLCYS